MTQREDSTEFVERVPGSKGQVIIRRDYRHKVRRMKIFNKGIRRVVTDSGLANQYQPIGEVFDIYEVQERLASYNSLDDARSVAKTLVELDRAEWERYF